MTGIEHHPRVIDINDDFSVEWWCFAFQCSPAELQRAVAVVGYNSEDVQAFLVKRPSGT